MITELTPEQLAKFDGYVEKWTKLGLTTARRTAADAAIDFGIFQKKVLQKEPVPVELYDSPAKCWARVNEIYSKREGRAVNLKFVYPYFDCQFWAGWFAFYEFMRHELGVEYSNVDTYEAMLACQPYGMVFPLDEVCIVCQPPTVIKRNKSGLHCENGPALSYNGDNEIYALNGIVMPKEFVMTSAVNIKAADVMKETNVEIRRELIRKIGIESLMEQMPHKLLDKRDNYEVYSIELSTEVKDARYLKMLNPSLQIFHLEGLDPSIGTVKDALLWRNQNMFENAEILT